LSNTVVAKHMKLVGKHMEIVVKHWEVFWEKTFALYLNALLVLAKHDILNKNKVNGA
jgi:hypothetical protein